jgi:hypothetical protein
MTSAQKRIAELTRTSSAGCITIPMVTENPASRYGDRAPGYITSNGLGSLEIGAADD